MQNKTERSLVPFNDASVIDAFSSESGLTEVVTAATAIVTSFEHDISTASGRKLTAGLSRKVSSLKVKIDGIGKELTAEIKSKAKLIDGNRKNLRDQLDQLRDEARKPLSDWEHEEDTRLTLHRSLLARIESLSRVFDDCGLPATLEIMEAFKKALIEIDVSALDEFEEVGAAAQERGLALLETGINAEIGRIKDAARLAEVEAELAEMRKSEEARLAAEAAHKKKMEKKAQDEIDRLAKELAESKREASEKLSLKHAAEEARADEIRKAEEDRNKKIREEAETKEREASEKLALEHAAEEARADEIRKAKEAWEAKLREEAETKEREERDRLRRENNTRHVNSVTRKVTDDIRAITKLNKEDASALVEAILSGKVRHVTINF